MALFAALALVHVAAMAHWLALPIPLVFFALPIVIGLQFVAVRALQPGGDDKAPPASISRRWRLFLEGLRCLPRGWQLFALPFWYVYVPLTFFTRLIGSEGDVVRDGTRLLLKYKGRLLREVSAEEAFRLQANQLAAFSAILCALTLVQFLLLRFIVPRREQILAAVDGRG